MKDKQPQTVYVNSDKTTGIVVVSSKPQEEFPELKQPVFEPVEKRESVYIHTLEELAQAFREVAEKAFNAGILIGENEGYGSGMEAHLHNDDAIDKDDYLDQHYPLPKPINTNQ